MAFFEAPVSPFRNDCLADVVALITGGASGIGLKIATEFARHGCRRLVLMGRRAAVLASAAASLRSLGATVETVTGDVRLPADAAAAVAAAVGRFGKLTVLVNCAAGNFLAAAADLSPNGFRTVMEIDALGVFTMSSAARAALALSKSSRIVNISATLHYGASWWQSHAAAAKAAIDSLTRSLALEWGADGIRVTGIAPGPIADTPGMTKLAPGITDSSPGIRDSSPGALLAAVGAMTPLGRLGDAWDVALAAVFLASAAGRYVTGETMVVDGGSWLSTPCFIPRDAVGVASRGVERRSRGVGLPVSKL